MPAAHGHLRLGDVLGLLVRLDLLFEPGSKAGSRAVGMRANTKTLSHLFIFVSPNAIILDEFKYTPVRSSAAQAPASSW